MLRDKPVSHLILILFLSALAANLAGEALRIFLHFVFWENSIIEKGFLQYHVDYNIGPFSFNLIILALSFSLSLKFNVITLLGILVGWYYFKYSY